MKISPSYPAKVLLYGEYSVIDGSKALALPLHLRSGGWTTEGVSDYNARPLLAYLRKHIKDSDLEVARMEDDFGAGLRYTSDIPDGYGIGSSGSVAAAILDRYGTKSTYGMDEARKILIDIESFFHGRSSGLDPMVSYIQKPILCSQGCIKKIDYLDVDEVLDGYLLLDSGRSRSTKTYVEIYKKLKTQQSFLSGYHRIYDLNNLIIEKILHQKIYSDEVKILSELQYIYFKPMIPEHIQEIWKYGLDSGDFSMKLCGAGGGGYFLVKEMEVGALNQSYPSLNTVRIIQKDT